MLRALALVLLLSSTTLADAVAIIDGPDSGRAGDLIVLDGSKSAGDGFRWVVPEGLQTIGCGGVGPGQLAFASGKSASYTFALIAADKDAAIDYVTHTVTITGAVQPGPEPTPDPVPDDPTPTPMPVLEQLEKVSRDSSRSLNDPTTANGLAQAIMAVDAQMEQMCSSGQCPGLGTAKAMMVAAIERRLHAREGMSRNVNWLDGWRKPINAAIQSVNANDVPSYRAVMRAVASGLSG